MQINAAVLRGAHQPFTIEQLILDEPRSGEVLVKIAASGVCHSDYHLVTGATQHPMPLVPGHEGAGVIEAVGPGVTSIERGDHVILNWAPYCGHCFYCQRGKPNLCDTFIGPIWAGTMLDGTVRLHSGGQDVYHFSGLSTFAEYAVVPQESVVVIRKDAPLKVAALVGCAVATGVGAAMYTAGVRAGESVVVYGCGGVGLSILQGALLCGAGTIIAVDTNQKKMDIACQFGATHALQSGADTVGAIRELTNGRGADHVFEAVGIPALQEEALHAARPGGTIVLAGLSAMGTGTNLPGAVITRQEKVIKGSYYGTVQAHRDFPMLIDLYMAGKLRLDEMVSEEYRLDQINEAYEVMRAGDSARGVVIFPA
jgi:S-(hydroxymethyl)glutathione dehydrogenase / alcohol dehydrogenase